MINPWNLTPKQAQTVAALICNGANAKKAGRLLGCTARTVNINVERAKKRMGVATKFDLLVTWDRWVRDPRRTA